KHFEELVDLYDRAPQGVDARSGQVQLRAAQKNSGGILSVLEVNAAAESDGVGTTDDTGFNGLGGARSQTLIASGAVHGPRPEPRAGDAVRLKIDARVSFVGLLEHAIVGSRQQGSAFRDGSTGVELFRSVDRGRACVDDVLDLAGSAGGFKNV